MKIVLDTNVLVSGMFYSGPPSKILDGWRGGKFKLVLTPEILSEYKIIVEHLGKGFPTIESSLFLELLVIESEMCNPLALIHPVCTDPDDDKFFAAAISGGASIIVSGDKHLLRATGYRGVEVLPPRQFVERFLRG